MLADNSVNTQRGRGSCKSVTGTNWSCTYTTMDVADEDNWCMGHLTTGVGVGGILSITELLCAQQDPGEQNTYIAKVLTLHACTPT